MNWLLRMEWVIMTSLVILSLSSLNPAAASWDWQPPTLVRWGWWPQPPPRWCWWPKGRVRAEDQIIVHWIEIWHGHVPGRLKTSKKKNLELKKNILKKNLIKFVIYYREGSTGECSELKIPRVKLTGQGRMPVVDMSKINAIRQTTQYLTVLQILNLIFYTNKLDYVW